MVSTSSGLFRVGKKVRLQLILKQLQIIRRLIRGNDWERFLRGHVIAIQVEIERQLHNLYD